MANILDGKYLSNKLIDEAKKRIEILKEKNVNLKIVDIIVGSDEGSLVYVKNKQKKFNEVGIEYEIINYGEDIKESDLCDKINKLNLDEKVNGIFIELPLPKNLDSRKIINMIAPKKDIEGFTNFNLGALVNNENVIAPCTAEGIIELLKYYNIETEGKNCVVVGRSNIVGKPVALLMLNENATVTICHSKTDNLKNICKMADILIVAINKENFINEDYIKKDVVIIDVGIHRMVKDGKNIVIGDVDFESVLNKASYITPVPGGVGPMTVAMLIKHTINTVSEMI